MQETWAKRTAQPLCLGSKDRVAWDWILCCVRAIGCGVAVTVAALDETEQVLGASVGEYLCDWLAHVRGRVRRVTYEGYEDAIGHHVLPQLGAVALAELTPLQLQRLYSDLLNGGETRPQLAGGTVRNLHRILHQAFGQAVRWQLLGANPAAGAQPPRSKRSERIAVGPETAQRLLDATAETAYELPCALALASGMRRGEILALRWSDLSPDYSQLQVVRTLQPTRQGLIYEEPKSARSRRTILLPDFIRPYLVRQRADQERRRQAVELWEENGLVIDRGNGMPRNPDTLSAGWSRYVRSLGLPGVRFHDLRHAHATLLLLQGVHPKVVSERLGHASIGITLDTYSHVLPSLQSQAVEAFDQLFPTPGS
jgi:integrase